MENVTLYYTFYFKLTKVEYVLLFIAYENMENIIRGCSWWVSCAGSVPYTIKSRKKSFPDQAPNSCHAADLAYVEKDHWHEMD